MSFQHLVTSFIRTQACREKCGYDGKNLPVPSTDFDSIDQITVVKRQCGCLMQKCSPRYYVPPPTPVQSCWTVHYFFVPRHGVRGWQAVCKRCMDIHMQYSHRPYDPIPHEFIERHLPYDETDSYFVPTDLEPRFIFRNYVAHGEGNLDFGAFWENRGTQNHWSCYCGEKLYFPVYDCVACAPTIEVPEQEEEELNELELNVDPDDFIDIDVDNVIDEFRQQNILTPVSLITDSDDGSSFDRRVIDDLIRRLQDFDEDLSDDDANDILQRNEEELMLQYNGYF